MFDIKRNLYRGLGFLCVGIAYIGFITPGIPFSIFLVIAAWAFAKSSPKMEKWLYNHPWFGPFLTNWVKKRVFPQKGKYAMILVMSSTLIITWFATENIKMILDCDFELVVIILANLKIPLENLRSLTILQCSHRDPRH